jgi:hypothetical protein
VLSQRWRVYYYNTQRPPSATRPQITGAGRMADRSFPGRRADNLDRRATLTISLVQLPQAGQFRWDEKMAIPGLARSHNKTSRKQCSLQGRFVEQQEAFTHVELCRSLIFPRQLLLDFILVSGPAPLAPRVRQIAPPYPEVSALSPAPVTQLAFDTCSRRSWATLERSMNESASLVDPKVLNAPVSTCMSIFERHRNLPRCTADAAFTLSVCPPASNTLAKGSLFRAGAPLPD